MIIRFLIRFVLFALFSLFIIELYLRINHITNDIPRRQITNGIQNYRPNQQGYWNKGAHHWEINEYGWPGRPPKNFESLITLVGDSHIENFMNPPECQMAYLMNSKKNGYNFFQAGRSGISLIEAMEVVADLQRKWNPERQIVFLKESDLKESLRNLGVISNITQFDYNEKMLVRGKLKAPILKLILYNVKTLFYFRNKISAKMSNSVEKPKESVKSSTMEEQKLYGELLDFVKKNYDLQKVNFAFHPDTPHEITALFKNRGLKYFEFEASDIEKWKSAPNDYSHWSCYGFKEAANQLRIYLKSN